MDFGEGARLGFTNSDKCWPVSVLQTLRSPDDESERYGANEEHAQRFSPAITGLVLGVVLSSTRTASVLLVSHLCRHGKLVTTYFMDTKPG